MDAMNMDEDKKKAKVSIGAMLSVMEIVIAIGIFAIISTFLLRFFTVANRLSDEAREVSKAGIAAEGVFEYIKANGFLETAEDMGFELDGERAFVKYNENFGVISSGREEAPAYAMEVIRVPEKGSAGILCSYNIKITKLINDSLLFDFHGKTYEKVVGDEEQ